MNASLHRAGGGRRIRPSATSIVVLFLAALVLLLCVAGPAAAYVPGKIVWTRLTGSSAHERGLTSVAKAPKGHFVAAGWVHTSAARGDDILVVKYNAAGHALWTRVWDGGGGGAVGDWARAVACDAKGNVYVTGSAGGSVNYDIVTIKYSSSGAFKWKMVWAGEESSSDEPQAMAVDANGVVVAGARYYGSMKSGIVVVKYDAAGAEQWVHRWESSPIDPQDGNKWPSDVALDGNGDAYVVGSSYYAGVGQAIVLKLAAADGLELHHATYDAVTGSYAGGVAVRGEAVAVAGWAAQVTDQQDALVWRFDRDLVEQSRLEYADPRGATSRDFGEDVAIGAHGSVFVAGYSNFPGTGYLDSALVLKVNAAGTAAAWAQRYKPSGKGAVADELILDGADNVYVGGYLDTPKSEEDMLLLKYSATGARKWARDWHDAGKDDDWAGGLALGGTNVLYVAGAGAAKGGYYHALAMRINR
jgi:hypothetical protein